MIHSGGPHEDKTRNVCVIHWLFEVKTRNISHIHCPHKDKTRNVCVCVIHWLLKERIRKVSVSLTQSEVYPINQ